MSKTYALTSQGAVIPSNLMILFKAKGGSKYRVLQKLGSGSFATVWLAKDLPKGYANLIHGILLFPSL
jgi:serine/threonine protein kinase